MRNIRALISCLTVLISTPIIAARAADTLELGVNELAQEIVRNSRINNATTIAVASFPHADNTCSELSNYIVDELVLSLFLIPDVGLQIIERAQLGTILAELGLGLTGAMDANTTREIGRIHGVNSLIIGSITVVGDRLRIIARMISTETGAVYAAAATTVPRTDTVTALMGRPAAGGCGLVAGGPPTAQPDAPQVAMATPGGVVRQGDVEFRIVSVARISDQSRVIIVLELMNNGQSVLPALWVARIPSIVDNLGGIMYLSGLAGMNQCGNWFTLGGAVDWFDETPAECLRTQRQRFVNLIPGQAVTVNLIFSRRDGRGDATIAGSVISFAGNLQILRGSQFEILSVSIPNIPI